MLTGMIVIQHTVFVQSEALYQENHFLFHPGSCNHNGEEGFWGVA